MKIGEDTETKDWILEESWRKSMEDVNSWRSWWVSMVLGRSWRKEARRKSFGNLEEFPNFGRLDLLSLIGLYRNVKGRIWRSRLHETCSWLKILRFHIDWPKNKSKCPLKVAPNLLVKVIIGKEDCFCIPIKNRVFDKILGQIRIFLFHTKLKRRS